MESMFTHQRARHSKFDLVQHQKLSPPNPILSLRARSGGPLLCALIIVQKLW